MQRASAGIGATTPTAAFPDRAPPGPGTKQNRHPVMSDPAGEEREANGVSPRVVHAPSVLFLMSKPSTAWPLDASSLAAPMVADRITPALRGGVDKAVDVNAQEGARCTYGAPTRKDPRRGETPKILSMSQSARGGGVERAGEVGEDSTSNVKRRGISRRRRGRPEATTRTL